jgi:anti-anti-sigma factor
MEFTSSKNNDFYVLDVKGRMDATTAHEFEKQGRMWLEQNEKSILIDMSGVEYISSAGLRSILVAAKETKAAGGEMIFCGLSGIVAEVFKMSGFEAMFKVFATKDEAILNG